MAAADTVKYGIVGMGMMGREHLISLHHLLNEGHKELLNSGLCDVVVVSSPNMTHYQILMDIINHPKPHHVLIEKPLCTTVTHSEEIISVYPVVVKATRKRQDMLVQIRLEYRYMPPVPKLIEIFKGGNVRQVKMVVIQEHQFPFLVKLFASANPVCVMASGVIDVNHKDEIYDGKVPDIINNAYVIIEFDNGSRGMLDLRIFAEGSKQISIIGDVKNVIRSVSISVRFSRQLYLHFRYEGLHHGSSYLEHLNFLTAIRAKGEQALAVDL
ncbi:hypothetical protein FNV43_RR00398 [Rhamnella rubrinervis]|uniref:Gfo/Idh/MocA-like oxidoreductase N-terminal domain-containing protein n=1 Tax=Rhamnella rubrinervis TaxID=2594499 RepID=A0A8K0HNH7_9ROSA|nr:hypothetical protein FNV43_RR00398 [Rhamnella rubrinervis]